MTTCWFPCSITEGGISLDWVDLSKWCALPGTNISPARVCLKMTFLFARLDMLVPWRDQRSPTQFYGEWDIHGQAPLMQPLEFWISIHRVDIGRFTFGKVERCVVFCGSKNYNQLWLEDGMSSKRSPKQSCGFGIPKRHHVFRRAEWKHVETSPSLNEWLTFIVGKTWKPPTRWWFQIFFVFIPIRGNDPIWRAYFSDGLKPPTSQFKTFLSGSFGRERKANSPELSISHSISMTKDLLQFLDDLRWHQDFWNQNHNASHSFL